MATVPREFRATAWIAALVIVSWGAWRLLPDLDHPMIMGWDESVHQAAARGTLDTPLYPHVYAHRLYPAAPNDWVKSEVWLHKPTLPFWLGALAMKIVGVRPGALRLVSALSAILTALGLAWIVRRFGGPTQKIYPWIGVAAAAFFLSLTFGWDIVQGYQFGDVTDATLALCTTASFACLIKSVESKSLKWAALTGAAAGLGYLCKSALALPVLGAFGVMWTFGLLGVCKGPRMTQLLTTMGTAVAVALPWNIYCKLTWPVAYKLEAEHTLDHLRGRIENWNRPFDAIMAEINGWQFKPFAVAVPFLAGIWLLVYATKKRDTPSIATALWLWSTWIVLSISPAKVPGTTWGCAPMVAGAIVLLAHAARTSPAWAGVLTAGLSTNVIMERYKDLSIIRTKLPHVFDVTRSHAGLAEGVALAIAAALVLGLVGWPLRKHWWSRSFGGAIMVACIGYLIAKSTYNQTVRRDHQREAVAPLSWVAETGRALATSTPTRSVFFLSQTHDPAWSFENLSLMLYSGRETYPRSPDISTARRHGLHPYLISSTAEPYADVPNVPAYAWMRAYDLNRPHEAPAPPSRATRIPEGMTDSHVLAYAAGPLDGTRDRWAFYIDNRENPASRISIAFVTAARTIVTQAETFHDVLSPTPHTAPWYILPVIGPRLVDTIALELGNDGRRVAVHR